MKKFMILALTLTFVIALAVSAMAAQPVVEPTIPPGGTNGTSFDSTANGTSGLATWQDPNNYNGTSNPNFNLVPPATPGAGGAVGAEPVPQIHSNYTGNTNACASCHATHTAVGMDLLQWASAQDACEACHDGTLSVATYNVVDGLIANTSAMTKAGRFSNDPGVGSKSMHNFKDSSGTNTLELKDAPGGLGDFSLASATNVDAKNLVGTTFNLTTRATALWNSEFECISCHTPHGAGGNARILNADIAGSALSYPGVVMEAVVGTNTFAAKIPATGVIKDRAGADTLTQPSANPGEYAVMLTAPYPKGITVYPTGTTAKASYVPTVAALTADGKTYTVQVQNGRTEIIFSAAAIGLAPKVDFFAGLKVKMQITDYLKGTESVVYGRGFNDFCGACHTDYNTNKYKANAAGTGFDPAQQKVDVSAGVTTFKYWLDSNKKVPFTISGHAVDSPTGFFSKAYRHTVGFDATSSYGDRTNMGLQFESFKVWKEDMLVPANSAWTSVKVMSCITCHVSHGTDEGVWAGFKTTVTAGWDIGQFNGSEVFDTTVVGGNNRGSNLKRMPNMGTCETCHRKGLGSLGHEDGTGTVGTQANAYAY